MNKKYPKIGLALSGGAALGIAHVGALQALADHNVPISYLSGTSAGAVVAAGLAFGLTPEQMSERAKNLSWYKLSNISYSRMGLITTQGVGNMMKEILGDVNIEDAKIPLAIVATNIENGEAIIFKKGSVAEAVMASVCIPGLFVPTEYQGKKLVDGGLVKNPSAQADIYTYARSEMNYYITYYDTDVFENVTVNDNGEMSYTIKSNAKAASYMNIVFVIK